MCSKNFFDGFCMDFIIVEYMFLCICYNLSQQDLIIATRFSEIVNSYGHLNLMKRDHVCKEKTHYCKYANFPNYSVSWHFSWNHKEQDISVNLKHVL